MAIAGATKQFYCDPNGLNGLYSLDVVTNDGQKLSSCGKQLNLPITKKASVYPNPVQVRQDCTVELTGFDPQELEGAILSIFNDSGGKVYFSSRVEPLNVVKLCFAPGIYIGHIVTIDGVDRVFKVIVR